MRFDFITALWQTLFRLRLGSTELSCVLDIHRKKKLGSWVLSSTLRLVLHSAKKWQLAFTSGMGGRASCQMFLIESFFFLSAQNERFGDVKCDRVTPSRGNSGSADTSIFIPVAIFSIGEIGFIYLKDTGYGVF